MNACINMKLMIIIITWGKEALCAQTLPSWPMIAAAVRWWPSTSHIKCSSMYVCQDIFLLTSSFLDLYPFFSHLYTIEWNGGRWQLNRRIDGRASFEFLPPHFQLFLRCSLNSGFNFGNLSSLPRPIHSYEKGIYGHNMIVLFHMMLFYEKNVNMIVNL